MNKKEYFWWELTPEQQLVAIPTGTYSDNGMSEEEAYQNGMLPFSETYYLPE